MTEGLNGQATLVRGPPPFSSHSSPSLPPSCPPAVFAPTNEAWQAFAASQNTTGGSSCQRLAWAAGPIIAGPSRVPGLSHFSVVHVDAVSALADLLALVDILMYHVSGTPPLLSGPHRDLGHLPTHQPASQSAS